MKKTLQNTSTYKISAKSVRGFGSYEHLKFRPMRRLKYRLSRHNDVIVVTSQILLLPLCRIRQLDTCAKFHDHRSNNSKVMMGGPHALMPPPMTDSSKKPMSNRVKTLYDSLRGPFVFKGSKRGVHFRPPFVRHSKLKLRLKYSLGSLKLKGVPFRYPLF